MLFSATPSPSSFDVQSNVEMIGYLLAVVQAVPSDCMQSSQEPREKVGEAVCACTVVASGAVVAVEQLAMRKELASLVEALIILCSQGLGGLRLASALVDLLLAINSHPLQARLPELGHGLFDACVQYLLPCAMYPKHFVDWSSCDIDEFEFLQFRQQDFPELLREAFELNGLRYAIWVLDCF
jgi:hypothetical protein